MLQHVLRVCVLTATAGLIFCQLPAVRERESSSQVESEEEEEESEEEEGSGETQPVQER